VFKVGTSDISQYCDTSEWTDDSDVHDTTGYGASGHGYDPGLADGKVTVGGTYDTTALTGPRAVLVPALRTKVLVTRQPEGTGTGKPQDKATCVLKSYVETAPVADYTKWTAEFTIDGVTDRTPQT